MNPTIVKQYRAILNLIHPKPRTCELVGDDLDTLKTDAQNLLGGSGVKFVPAQSTGGSQGLTLIYHPSFQGGKTWLGIITPFETTEDMSVGNTIEKSLTQAA